MGLSRVSQPHPHPTNSPAQRAAEALRISTPLEIGKRYLPLIEAGAHRMFAAGLGFFSEDLKNIPQLQEAALRMRDAQLAQAEQKVKLAQTRGAVVNPADIQRGGDLGSYALSLVAQGVAPTTVLALSAYGGGRPAVAGTAYAMNTAFNVDHQLSATGQADRLQAAVGAAISTALQLPLIARFPAPNAAWFPVLGATGGAGTVAGQKFSTFGLPVDPQHEANFAHGMLNGALMTSVLGPVAGAMNSTSVRPTRTFKTDNPLQILNKAKTDIAVRTTQNSPPLAWQDWRVLSNTSMSRQLGPIYGLAHTEHNPVTGLPIQGEFAPGHAGTTRLTNINEQNFAQYWTTKPGLNSRQVADSIAKLHLPSFDGKYKTLADYTAAAYALSQQPADQTNIWRLHTHTDATITVNIKEAEAVVTTRGGKIAAFRKTLDKEGRPDGLAYLKRLVIKNPAIGLKQLSDHPLAISALLAQAQYWLEAGVSPDLIADGLLSMREKIERGVQKLVEPEVARGLAINNQQIAGREWGPYYDLLVDKRLSPDEMIEIALETKGQHFARPDYDYATADGRHARPPIQWAEASNYPSADLNSAVQWIEHRLNLLEFRTFHDYVDAAHALKQQASSESILRHSLTTGERLTFDKARNLLLVEVDDLPYTLFRPKEGAAYWQQITQNNAHTTLADVLSYAHDSSAHVQVLPEPKSESPASN